MRILKFTGATSREVLGQVRATLGEDALIISNRRTETGHIEILAADPRSVADLPPPTAAPAVTSTTASTPASTPAPAQSAHAQTPMASASAPTARDAQPARPSPIQRAAPGTPAPAPERAESDASAQPKAPPPARPSAHSSAHPPTHPPSHSSDPSSALPPTPITGPELAQALRHLQGELAGRFDSLMWGGELQRSPQRTVLLRELLEAGLSIELARDLLLGCPQAGDAHGLRQWIRAALVERLQVPAPGEDLLTRPGIYALVGPTGVGKTTTVAKLAARCIALHGRDSLALVATDSYRVAAHEQLQAFGRIMEVPVHPMRSDADLRELLHGLSGKAVVLIDNMGLSQRDANVARQLRLLGQAGVPVRRILVLNAASQGDTLEEVVQAYAAGQQPGPDAPAPLGDCIISKVDEAAHIGPALDIAIRHRLQVHYVTDGQKVPDNLRMPSAAELVDHALARTASAPALFAPDAASLAALLAHAGSRPDGAGAPGGPARQPAPLAPWLPWLLHHDNRTPAQGLRDFDAGLDWARGDCATRLAHEAWRHWASPRQQPAHAAGPASAHWLAALWCKAAREAAPAPAPLLAVHGKASLAPRLPRASLCGSLLADTRGQVLSVPAQSLNSQFGHGGIVNDNDDGHDGDEGGGHDRASGIDPRLDWLQRQLPAAALVHLLDGIGAAQLQALARGPAHWLAAAPGALKVRLAGSGTGIDTGIGAGPAESVKALSPQLAFTPLPPSDEAGADDWRDGEVWWLGHAEVTLPMPGRKLGHDPNNTPSHTPNGTPGTAPGGDTPDTSADATPRAWTPSAAKEDGAVRLLVLRRATARAGSDAAATLAFLAKAPHGHSPARLAHWYLQGLRLRAAFKYMAPAWFALEGGPAADSAWPHRALVAGQLGAVAWQAAHDPRADALRALLSCAGGWSRQAGARATVEATLRSFALMEWAETARAPS